MERREGNWRNQIYSSQFLLLLSLSITHQCVDYVCPSSPGCNQYFSCKSRGILCFGSSSSQTFSAWEVLGLLIWFIGFGIENIADMQLGAFTIAASKARKSGDPEKIAKYQVLNKGLWRYSRHPNYFGEFLLWIGHFVYNAGSYTRIWHYAVAILSPFVAYYYLVHFTGAWMAEQSSVKKRGEAYIRYQKETNIFFPGPPRVSKEE
jgi:steroid 5-alpha reductase family enzyme